MNNQSKPNWNLPNLSTPVRVLFTGYLLVVGLGLAMSGYQILLTHGKADGKFGLSVDDVVYSYYGDRGNSRLEGKLRGTMKDKAPTHVRTAMVKWVREGGARSQWDAHINTLFQEHCNKCHGGIPGLADFTSFEGVESFIQIDSGATVDSLARVSHIHLFGIAFIFFFFGLIFSFSVSVPPLLKNVAIGFPFAFLIVDVMSWWLTKLSPNFAWLTLIGGFGYMLSSVFMWCTCMYQMWIMARNPSKYQSNEWLRN